MKIVRNPKERVQRLIKKTNRKSNERQKEKQKERQKDRKKDNENEKKSVLPFLPALALSSSKVQSMGLLNVGEATNMHPKTSNSSALHFGAVMFLPSSTTAKAAVENIFN